MRELDVFFDAARSELPGIRLARNEPMSAHTTFRVGGPAELMAFPKNDTELEKVVSLALNSGIEPLLLGAGSNVLAPDGTLHRLVVKTRDMDGEVRVEGTRITAASGTTLARIASCARDAGLSGFEFAAGIPGTLGGAMLMNAGAYGGEMKDVAVSTRWMDENGEIYVSVGEQQRFSYRHSAFSDKKAYILSSKLELTPGDPSEIRRKTEELTAKRRASQPLELPSAGSAFKRPAVGYAAALIDQAGLKGLAAGGAAVSEKHAGFIVNTGGATASDVKKLIGLVQEAVFKNSGVMLEPEIRILT